MRIIKYNLNKEDTLKTKHILFILKTHKIVLNKTTISLDLAGPTKKRLIIEFDDDTSDQDIFAAGIFIGHILFPRIGPLLLTLDKLHE